MRPAMDDRIGRDVESILSHLAQAPGVAFSTAERAVTKRLLLKTDGEMLLSGSLWGIVARHLGAGVYSLTLKKRGER